MLLLCSGNTNEHKMLHVCSWLLCSLLFPLASRGISNLRDSLGSFSDRILAPGPSWHYWRCSGEYSSRWLRCPSKRNAPQKKGQNPSVSTHHLPLSGPGLWDEGQRSHRRFLTSRIKKSLGLFKESLQNPESLWLQNKYNIIFIFEKTILKLYQNLPLCIINF